MDADEFERLFLENRRALERFVRFRINSREDADDVLQNTLLSAWSGKDSLQNRGAWKPWLFQIARNACKDYYRKRGRTAETPLDDNEAGLFAPNSERGLFVRDTLDRLPLNSAEILRLTYLDDLPQTEITRLLGLPAGTVKSRLHTAKHQFRGKY